MDSEIKKILDKGTISCMYARQQSAMTASDNILEGFCIVSQNIQIPGLTPEFHRAIILVVPFQRSVSSES
ncbi:hypothetical protein K0U27_11345 [archaeon]|nr:hypothetical protein [archaeon]